MSRPSPARTDAARRRARASPSATASSSSRTTRSSPSSRATAPDRTSGARACASWTPRWPRRTAAGAASTGWRCTPARKPTGCSTPGCPRRRSRRAASTWCPSRGRSPRPVGGGIRSLNVALRQMLDLYVCLRPVRWFKGVPSPVQAPGEGRHGDLPREHRGHLRRHRVRGWHAPRTTNSSSCSARPSPRRTPRSASRTAPASASSRCRRKARNG